MSSDIRASPEGRTSKKDRKFCLLLYPDSTDYSCDFILSNVRLVHQWAYILHDRDSSDDGELKKPHYHVVIRYESPRSIETIANSLGLDSQWIQPCKKFKSSLQYLVHRTPDSWDKFQYDPKEIKSNIDTLFQDIGESNECTALALIYSYIDTGRYSLAALSRYLCTEYKDPYLYSVFRRNFSIIKFYYETLDLDAKANRWRKEHTNAVCVDMNLINELLRRNKNENL